MSLQEATVALAEAYLGSCRRGMGWGPAEADDRLNDASRDVILACWSEHGAAWLGKVNVYADDFPGLWLWTPGQMVYNFGADFVLPVASEEVALLIGRYRNTPLGRLDEWPELLGEIASAIDKAGGVMLCWS